MMRQTDGAVTVQWFLIRREAHSSRVAAQSDGARNAGATTPRRTRAVSFLLRFSHWLDHSPAGLALGLIALGSLIFTVLSWGN